MSESRIVVQGETQFNPREWLRRELLWASLMAPYGQQLNDWLEVDGNRFDQHMGNVSRQHIYSQETDSESQAIAFFNGAKVIGGRPLWRAA